MQNHGHDQHDSALLDNNSNTNQKKLYFYFRNINIPKSINIYDNIHPNS